MQSRPVSGTRAPRSPRSIRRSELIEWTDAHLDPLYNEARNPNALARDQRRWAKEGGWSPGKVRCPEYRTVDGNLTRGVCCYEPGAACPEHGGGGT